MAIDNRLQVFNEEGQSVDYDILASDVKFMPDGKDLPTKLAEMEQEIEEAGYTPPAGGIPKTDLAPSVQQALDDVANKVNKETGKGLSTNDYTTDEKSKLGNLPTSDQLTQQLGGKANDNAVVKSISVNGTAQSKDTNGNVNVVVPTLTLDNEPTEGSNNAVKSGGIKTAIDQVTPTIDANGYWVIGGQSTGQKAQGPAGNTQILDPTTFDPATQIINNVGDGGETDALSAEMGKVIRQNIMILLNALGTYAFPEGKPVLSWGSTVIKHDISISGVTGLSISDIEVDGESVAQMPSQIIDYKSLSFKMTKTASQIYHSVAISMGGFDITEEAGVWDESTGTVTIAHVTGNIVVVASALTLVEYLQSDGNQWIDTGIIASTNFKCNVKADIISQPDTKWRRLLGARDDTKFAIAISVKNVANGGTIYSQIGDVIPAVFVTSSVQQTTGLHTITVQTVSGTYSINIDGTVDSVAYTDLGNTPDLTLYLFSEHRADSTINSISAKVYHCKIWNGNNLVFDAIPVRVGQVGYMYDKVSETLLPNIGTGSFTLGNDKTA